MPRPRMSRGAAALLAAALAAAGGGAAAALSGPQEAPRGRWEAAGQLATGRYAPGACLLADGRVLVAGGYSFEARRLHAGSELYDAAGPTPRWTRGPELALARNFPLVLPVPGGHLLVGGYTAEGTTTATDLVKEAGAVEPAPPAAEERELAAWAPLEDGSLLVCGGYSTRRRETLASAELYDPRTRAWRLLPTRMASPRFGHAAVRLADGKVLIVGGKLLQDNADVLPVELFDPATAAFRTVGRLAAGRDRCTAWLLPDGRRVLVAGGSAKEGGTLPARRCEVFDTRTERLEPGPTLLRDRMAHAATPLGEGRVLLTGGWCGSERRTTPVAELWDPAAERFVPAGEQAVGRHDHAAVRLRDGRVLVAGGKEAPARDGVETPLLAELWNPE